MSTAVPRYCPVRACRGYRDDGGWRLRHVALSYRSPNRHSASLACSILEHACESLTSPLRLEHGFVIQRGVGGSRDYCRRLRGNGQEELSIRGPPTVPMPVLETMEVRGNSPSPISTWTGTRPGLTARVVSRLARPLTSIVTVVLAPAARVPEVLERLSSPSRLDGSVIDHRTGPPWAVSVRVFPSSGVSRTVLVETLTVPAGGGGGVGVGVEVGGGGVGDGPGAGVLPLPTGPVAGGCPPLAGPAAGSGAEAAARG